MLVGHVHVEISRFMGSWYREGVSGPCTTVHLVDGVQGMHRLPQCHAVLLLLLLLPPAGGMTVRCRCICCAAAAARRPRWQQIPPHPSIAPLLGDGPACTGMALSAAIGVTRRYGDGKALMTHKLSACMHSG